MGAECGSGWGWRGGEVRAWKVPDKRWEASGGVWKGECWDKLGGISTPVCTKDKGGKAFSRGRESLGSGGSRLQLPPAVGTTVRSSRSLPSTPRIWEGLEFF